MNTLSLKLEYFIKRLKRKNMKKNLKYVLAAAVVGTGAYLWWKSNQKPKIFANVEAGIDKDLKKKLELQRKKKKYEQQLFSYEEGSIFNQA
jgi:hypothetical protein